MLSEEHNECKLVNPTSKDVGQKSSLVCRFFAKHGHCRFDTRCRFSHATEKNSLVEEAHNTFETESVEADSVATVDDGDQRQEEANTGESQSTNLVPRVNHHEDQSTIPCRFFSTNKRCWRGHKCHFLHERPPNQETKTVDRLACDSDKTKSVTTTEKVVEEAIQCSDSSAVMKSEMLEKMKRRGRLCRYFKKGQCTQGDRCKFYHPVQDTTMETSDRETQINEKKVNRAGPTATKRVVDKMKVEDVSEADQEVMRTREIGQLKKRFPHFTDHGKDKYSFTFVPTDPDWPYDVKDVKLAVSFPPDYPKTVFSVSVVPDPSLPDLLHKHIARSLTQWLSEKTLTLGSEGCVELCFRPFLRWLDRNIEDIFTDGLKRSWRELVAQAAGFQFIPHQQLKEAMPGSTPHDPSTNLPGFPEPTSANEENIQPPGGTDVENHDPAQSDELEGACAPVCAAKARGTEVELKGLQLLDGAASLLCSQFVITVQCSRCKNRLDVATKPDRMCASPCSRCGQVLSVQFRASLIHTFSQICGYMDLDGCQPFELLLARCEFVVACLECNKSDKLSDLYYGTEKSTWCNHCHQKMRISLQRVQFRHIQSSLPLQLSNKEAAIIAAAKKPKRPINDIPVKAGQPLPDNGTCKHYKKSYRWLRFPCCGKCYPCDVCHEENEDHEMKFASRMVCGYCAKEQPFVNGKPCVGCDSSLTRAKSSHWEGGKGCRDKIKMDRNDDKKYANQNKTQSRKSQLSEQSKSGAKNTKLRRT